MTQPHLKRVLGTPEILFLGINGVVGGGIFLLPGQVAAISGAASVWAYLLAGAVVALIGLSYAEASTMFGRTGGPVVYTSEALGKPAGFTAGWAVWLTYLIGWAVLLDGFTSYASSLSPSVEALANPLIIGLVVLFCFINTLGVRLGARVIQFFTVAKLVPLVALVFFGILLGVDPLLEGVPEGSGGILAAALVIIFAYGGFEAATIPAGEMRDPRRTVSVAVLGTIAGVTLLYMLIQYGALRLVPGLAGRDVPLAAAGEAMFAGGLVFMTVGALISIAGTQSGVALTAPRSLFALSQERMLPAFLSRVGRWGTPTTSIWLTGGLVAVLAISGTFQQLILLNVAARLYQYLAVCISVAVLRRRMPGRERPFRLPFGPAIPLLAAVMCVVLLSEQPTINLLAAAGAILFGLALYMLSQWREAGR